MNEQISFTMPIEQEEQYENDRSTYTPSVNIYKPLPLKAGERFVNELFIPLFDPAAWNIFNKSPEERELLGLVDKNPLTPINEVEKPLYSFYFKVPVHNVQEFVRDDGSTGYAQVVCPKHFNAYLTKAMGRRPLFKDERCGFCEGSAKGWDDFNARWVQIEEETGIKKTEMSVDGRREKKERDPVLKEAYGRAKDFEAKDKCIMNVFDLGKLRGTRRLDTEDEALGYQIYFAPKTVFQHLREQWTEDDKEGQLPFFSFYNPQGLQIIKLIKSTEKCKGRNLRDTEYNVMKGSVVALDEGWLNYLRSLDSMLDPSELLHIISYENMLMYTQPEESYNKPIQTPQAQAPQAQVPQAAPPVQVPVAAPAQVPQAAPPVQMPAQMPQAAPPAQVPAAPPAMPQAAPPQMPAAPPVQVPAQMPQAAPPVQMPQAAPPAQVPAAPPQMPAAPPAQMPQAPPQMPIAPTASLPTGPQATLPQMPQAAPPQMPAANPPIASGGANIAGTPNVQGAPTAEMPDRTPPTDTPRGSAFSW